jgi:hypothetical protein
MKSLPTWAVWSIVVPLVLLSPVIAFLLALAAEIAVWAVVDAGAPAGTALAASAALLIFLRKVRLRARRAISRGLVIWSENH